MEMRPNIAWWCLQAAQQVAEIGSLQQARALSLQATASAASVTASQLRLQLAAYPDGLVAAINKLLDQAEEEQGQDASDEEDVSSGVDGAMRKEAAEGEEEEGSGSLGRVSRRRRRKATQRVDTDPDVVLHKLRVPLGPQGVLCFPTAVAAAALPTGDSAGPGKLLTAHGSQVANGPSRAAAPGLQGSSTGGASVPHFLRFDPVGASGLPPQLLQQLDPAAHASLFPSRHGRHHAHHRGGGSRAHPSRHQLGLYAASPSRTSSPSLHRPARALHSPIGGVHKRTGAGHLGLHASFPYNPAANNRCAGSSVACPQCNKRFQVCTFVHWLPLPTGDQKGPLLMLTWY
jgi:hypothetical protein